MNGSKICLFYILHSRNRFHRAPKCIKADDRRGKGKEGTSSKGLATVVVRAIVKNALLRDSAGKS
jgi:hypothetical protein